MAWGFLGVLEEQSSENVVAAIVTSQKVGGRTSELKIAARLRQIFSSAVGK
jgi:hypothetical protein